MLHPDAVRAQRQPSPAQTEDSDGQGPTTDRGSPEQLSPGSGNVVTVPLQRCALPLRPPGHEIAARSQSPAVAQMRRVQPRVYASAAAERRRVFEVLVQSGARAPESVAAAAGS
ncbi:hypothetical protein EMIHUDRAFT_194554 [Emiliania huxleyi CCMP1516]|uniref:Uncharacterized protein n=2 Tax=Emiliania huxleyi TaxID=2903 RepID=A0A0D3L1R0_EMIH1|nr:hypothetical protein EMIHUDRAFT_194554 [Emiliania huxleyi CCMP1516]EOD41945.1 hypothetical protein EMIHUDRAFT_194554 [Emiliania huxleyi CCMP1516]|eukprot:XP_005794374.1 hypothetical protein EMIHUDRAFT_194554 [Emiliania huxleyi CCMP1516]